LLIAKRADLNAKDVKFNNMTPLDMAKQYQSKRVEALFDNAGAQK